MSIATISTSPESLVVSEIGLNQQIDSVVDLKKTVKSDSLSRNRLVPALVTAAACVISISSGVASVTPTTVSIDTPTYFSPNLILDETRLDLELIGRIREINSYGENWDGRGAMKAESSSISSAEEFIKQLSAVKGIPKPSISLATDGEIGFFWKSDSFILDLGINENGTYSYYAKLENGEELFNDDVMVTDPIPDEIAKLLLA